MNRVSGICEDQHGSTDTAGTLLPRADKLAYCCTHLQNAHIQTNHFYHKHGGTYETCCCGHLYIITVCRLLVQVGKKITTIYSMSRIWFFLAANVILLFHIRDCNNGVLAVE